MLKFFYLTRGGFMRDKILIATSSFNASLLENLDGFDLKINPFKKRLSEDELISLLDNQIVGIIAGLENYNDRVLEYAPNLRVISRCGVGIDNIDLKEIEKRGIILKNTPDSHVDAVAELTLGLMLDIIRKISFSHENLRNNTWQKSMGNLLKQKTVGIVGFGKVAKRLSELLIPFNVNILAYDEHRTLNNDNISYEGLETLLKESDIVSIHLPKNLNTVNLLNKFNLELMKPSSYLINTSRGSIVNEQDLYFLLKNKKIAGAAIDVFENEPYHGKLTELDNVVLTPHIGSYAVESRKRQESEAVNNLLNALNK